MTHATSSDPDRVPDDQYEVHVAAQLGQGRTRVLKRDELFTVVDEHGDIISLGRRGTHGVYLDDMRHLSELGLRLQGRRPILLSSHVDSATQTLVVDLSNAEFECHGVCIHGDTIHVRRERTLLDDGFCERISLHNYGALPLELELELRFDADFTDLFEVRGIARSRHGLVRAQVVSEAAVVHHYEALDGCVRSSWLRFAPAPVELRARQARWVIRLAPGEATALTFALGCECCPKSASGRRLPAVPAREVPLDFERAYAASEARQRRLPAWHCIVTSSNAIFNEWLVRSRDDLTMLTTWTEHGPYPYAGTPWYSTAFGRDGLITALQALPFEPSLARGVLAYLAEHQATDFDPDNDAEPGKILHERRRSEMARLREVPFERYYGSIDSTPLFALLAGEYLRRTDDLELVRHLWPALERALTWIEEHGDRDGDGYVEYGRRTAQGLLQQGWKDSHDSVFHADGRDALAPIALCEVQAYVYGARRAIAELAQRLGKHELAATQRARAEVLREQFERDFWMEDLGAYALALDGEKRPCRVVSSNAGHCLLTGIVAPERAERLVATLMRGPIYSGWGIRTLAAQQARYSPLSYHNGSIWPHDNALCALGMARYGYRREAARILEDLFVAASNFDMRRLPELFCGFDRHRGHSPTRYPVACAPQAWAAGSAFMLLQAALGLEIDGGRATVHVCEPHLPASIDQLVLLNLAVGPGDLDLRFERRPDGSVDVELLRANDATLEHAARV